MNKKLQFILFFIPCFLFSQDYIYKEFGLNEGLPSMQAYNIHQDKNGIIWFATDRGIANYNGYEIRQFGIKDGLLSNVILSFYPQPDGKVYCTTFDNSIFYFEEDFKGFRPYKYNHVLGKTLLHNHIISNIYFDINGSLHINCLYKRGKLVINNKGEVVENTTENFVKGKKTYAVYEDYKDTFFYYITANISNLKSNAKSLPSQDPKIQFIKLPDSDLVVFKNDTGVWILDKNGKIIRSVESKFRPIIVKAISSSRFFIGYLFGGGRIVDVNGNVIETLLKDQSITNFLIDREGGYWFTTLYSGVFYIKEPRIRVFNGNNIDIPIYSLTRNLSNELFASYDNGRVLRIDIDKRSDIYFESDNRNRSFLEYDAQSRNSLLYFQEKFVKNGTQVNHIPDPPYVLKFSEITKKRILVSQLGSIRQVDLNSNKPDTFIDIPFRGQDACYWQDDIYIASPKGTYLYTSSGKLIDLKQKNKLFSYRVDDIDYNEKRNELYLASLGQGLIIYNKNTESVTSISKKDGLLSDIANEVYIENENNIWVCTNSGLNKITFHPDGKFTLTGLKSYDGLLNDGISDIEIINDVVWIASKKGLVYAPKELFAPNKDADYRIRMKRVLVNEKETRIALLDGLSHDENRIEFNFEGVSLKSEGNLVYKYKLDGLDTKWYYTKSRKVTFSSLPYGEYRFKVAVQDTRGKEKFLEIPVSISPPFWKTGWFIALFIVLMLGIIYLFFKLRVLSYNKDITRELLRIIVRKIKRRESYFVFKEAGRDIRVKTDTILYVKSSGNYIELVTENKNFLVRCKIGDFIQSTPDPLEYIRIHRSYIVRIDKVEGKSKTEVVIHGEKLPVSDTYAIEIDKLIF